MFPMEVRDFVMRTRPTTFYLEDAAKRIDWLLWWRLQVLAQQPPCGEQDKKTGTVGVTHPILRVLLQASLTDLPDTHADHHQTWSCVVFSHPLISISLIALVPIRLGHLELPGPTRSGHKL
jgi:hypothetical protein